MKTILTKLLKCRLVQAGGLLAIIAAAAATIAWSSAPARSLKLEGAWVAKVVGMPLQWTYTLSPDPSGRRAAMYGTVQVAIRPSVVNSNLFPDFGTTATSLANWS